MIMVAFKTEEEIRDALYYAKNEANGTCNVKHLADANRVIKSLEKAIGEITKHNNIDFGLQDLKDRLSMAK